MASAELLEALRELRAAEPFLGLKPLAARLREQMQRHPLPGVTGASLTAEQLQPLGERVPTSRVTTRLRLALYVNGQVLRLQVTAAIQKVLEKRNLYGFA